VKARIVPTAQGARWLIDGWRLFRAAPLGWLAAVFAYWFLMTVISLVPIVGIAIASVLVPAFSVGFMALARAASRGARLDLALLFDGFRNGRTPMLVLGALYFACLVAVLGATMLADGGGLASWMASGRHPGEEAVQSEEFLAALALAAALYAPVMMMFWFAPPLAAWHSIGAVKSLFFSFFACLMNWRAFLAYGAVTALITVVLPSVVLTGVLLASGGALKLPVMGLVFPLLIVMLPTLFASFYASYRDVFADAILPRTSASSIDETS
jgi:hypothetical protein